MEHTPERWALFEDKGGFVCIVADGKHVVCFGHDYDAYGHMDEPDARRIVACVNKLAGWSIEDLENTEISVRDDRANPA